MILIDILVMSTSRKKWIPNVVLILVIPDFGNASPKKLFQIK